MGQTQLLPTPDPSLNPFFEPLGVAVIGVSTNPAKLGYGIAQNLVNSGYPGALHFVSPRGGKLFGRPIYTSVGEIPGPADLAVILVPPTAVPDMLEACGTRSIRAAVIASGGFRETGPEGAALEEACLAIARGHEMRLMGPNCIGLLDTHLPLDTTFLPPPGPPAGEIAFISHSGAICAAIVDWSRGQGFGFSRLVSLGNQADVTETDILPAVAADPHTAVIALYLESISDGRRFVDIARQITPHKPIVALKVGRTAAGKKAAASHTGALAGSEAAFNAALRRAGVHRAATAEEMFDWARALAWSPIPDFGFRMSDFRVAVLTNAGGPGVMAADAIAANGLTLAELDPGTEEGLRQLLPPAASIANPVDMLASASPEQYAAGLGLLLTDEGVDAILVILPPPPMFSAGAVAREIIPLIQTAHKPVVISLMGHGLVQEALAFFRAVKIPTYTFPEPAASALAAVSKQYSVFSVQYSVAGEQSVHPTSDIPHPTSGWLSPDTVFKILNAYGIQAPAYKIVNSLDDALAAAGNIGYPIALKIASPAITHKSDVGGVRLNLQDADEVTAAFNELSKLIEEDPEFLVQEMILSSISPSISISTSISISNATSQEIIIGVSRDPQFGPLLMFGSGGVEVEGLGDVAFALAPLSEAEARRLLDETWAGRKLEGYRNIPAVDKEAVVQTIQRLGQIAADYPQLAEIEINPLIVLEKGAVAVDGRARLV